MPHLCLATEGEGVFLFWWWANCKETTDDPDTKAAETIKEREKAATDRQRDRQRRGMKRRRPETAGFVGGVGGGVEDVEKNLLHTSFCSAANAISHLYTQAHHQQKVAFQAGQRHALENLFNWIHSQHGVVPSTMDIINYLKVEVENVNRTETTITQTQSVPSVSQQQIVHPNQFGRVDEPRQPIPSHHNFLSG